MWPPNHATGLSVSKFARAAERSRGRSGVMELTSKRIRFELPLPVTRKANGKQYQRLIFTLIRHIFSRVRRLTSRRLPQQYINKTLQIVLVRKTPTRVSKFKVNVRKVLPVNDKVIPKHWFELSKRRFCLSVLEALCRTPLKQIRRASHIRLEARRFYEAYFNKWTSSLDPKVFEDFFRAMGDEQGYVDPMIVYSPNFEAKFRKWSITGTADSPSQAKKIPIANRVQMKQTKRQSHPPAKRHKDKRKWRQTKIDDYFKPRHLMEQPAAESNAKQ